MKRSQFYLLLCVGSLLVTAPAAADRGGPKKQVCAPGTEMYGAPPPHGANIWCRQPMNDGSFIRQGMYSSYNRNGKLRLQGVYERDKPHGVWTKYDRDGNKVAATIYYDGNPVQRYRYNSEGKAINEAVDNEAKKKQYEARKRNRELNDWRHGKAYIPRSWTENRSDLSK